MVGLPFRSIPFQIHLGHLTNRRFVPIDHLGVLFDQFIQFFQHVQEREFGLVTGPFSVGVDRLCIGIGVRIGIVGFGVIGRVRVVALWPATFLEMFDDHPHIFLGPTTVTVRMQWIKQELGLVPTGIRRVGRHQCNHVRAPHCGFIGQTFHIPVPARVVAFEGPLLGRCPSAHRVRIAIDFVIVIDRTLVVGGAFGGLTVLAREPPQPPFFDIAPFVFPARVCILNHRTLGRCLDRGILGIRCDGGPSGTALGLGHMGRFGIRELRFVVPTVGTDFGLGRVQGRQPVARPTPVIVQFTKHQTINRRNLQQFQEPSIHFAPEQRHFPNRQINRQRHTRVTTVVPLTEFRPVTVLFR